MSTSSATTATEHRQAPALKRARGADGVSLTYRELGSGEPVLLLHGWPTSSYTWRNVMPAIAARNRVLALDLPGFGGSDKPLDADYGFEFFERAIDSFLAELGIDRLALAAHDVGGPVAMHWAAARPERVTKLALLNTLVYPEFSPAVLEFIKACTTPELREQLTSRAGLASMMKLGVADEASLSDEMLAVVAEPFGDEHARLALARAGAGLELSGFEETAAALPTLRMPVRVVYGEQDRILPDVGDTFARLQRDVPQARVTALAGCGHFLQEEEPQRVGELLAEFLAREH